MNSYINEIEKIFNQLNIDYNYRNRTMQHELYIIGIIKKTLTKYLYYYGCPIYKIIDDINKICEKTGGKIELIVNKLLKNFEYPGFFEISHLKLLERCEKELSNYALKLIKNEIKILFF